MTPVAREDLGFACSWIGGDHASGAGGTLGLERPETVPGGGGI
jgi:hypothetical protein